MNTTVGRIVHYKVNENDGVQIMNNGIKAGDILPAIIVRVWSEIRVQLKVFCDGPYDVWKTSVDLGSENGQWIWPAIAPVPESGTKGVS